MKPPIDYTLYLVTDRNVLRGRPLADAVAAAIRGGCTLIQLREKEADSREFYECAVAVKRVADSHGVPVVVNDRADIALAIDAAGVHVGASDLPAAAARAVMGPDRIVGVSVASAEEARLAEEAGADYLGAGAMFATGTKADADPMTLDELSRICSAVRLPVVAIGGIGRDTVTRLRVDGLAGIAVVSAVLGEDDIEAAARALKDDFLRTRAASPHSARGRERKSQ